MWSNFGYFAHFAHRVLLKAAIILLPLLGTTWVFGLLAVNQESSVFAWIFTILNSLQVTVVHCFFSFLASYISTSYSHAYT